jgi:hypothetical protein
MSDRAGEDVERTRNALDTAIEVGRERDGLLRALRDLRNRHGLLRQALAAVRAGDGGAEVAREALMQDAALAPDGESYESEPEVSRGG